VPSRARSDSLARMLRCAVVLASIVLLSSCGAGEGGARAALDEVEREDEAGASRPEREAARAVPAPREALAPAAPPSPASPEPATAPAALALSRLDGPTDAEDGAGGVARSTRAVAIDLDALRVPPRALDPVLVVGSRRFVHYHHPRVGTLRFVAAGPELLEEGAAAYVQFGDDEADRIPLTDALHVPAEVRR